MALFSRLFSRKQASEKANARLKGVEPIEPRYMLSVNGAAPPIDLGIVYVEQDSGSDLQGDLFELTWTGGADATQLTRVIIDGDQNISGFGVGDVFFDTSSGGFGADDASAFQLGAHGGIDGITATVEDGGTRLVLEFEGFNADERLFFEIDVDEVEDFETNTTDLDFVNEGFDPITSGVEFQGSQLTAEFAAPRFFDLTGNAEFRNRFDTALVDSGLDLPADNANGQRDRTAGAFLLDLEQIPLPASLSGNVYHDRDNDGLRDAGEEGISDVLVSLVDEAGIVVDVQLTDGEGFYQFDDVCAGTYSIVETHPQTWTDGLDTPGSIDALVVGAAINPGDAIEQITINHGDEGVEYNFGEFYGAEIRGRVQQSNRDGDCFGAAEDHPPVVGALVQLLDADGNVIDEATTDENGEYAFVSLPPGEYGLREITPDDLVDGGAQAGQVDGNELGTVDPLGTIRDISLSSGEVADDFIFCEHKPATIGGTVFHDKDGDGIQDPGEEGISGVEIQLVDENGNVVQTVLTDENGNYEFTGVVPGNYCLVEVQPEGWYDGEDTVGEIDGESNGELDPAGDKFSDIEIGWGDTGTDYDFGELKPGSISGRVHSDVVLDCEFNEADGEELLAGVVINLIDADGNVVATTTTDASGQYSFDNVAPATYSIQQIQPDGYFDGNATAGSGGGEGAGNQISSVTVGSGEELTDYDFCEIEPASISGRVHSDMGTQDCEFNPEDGEELLEAVVIELLDADGEVVASTTTDANGEYRFDGLEPSNYSIRQIQPGDYFEGAASAGSAGGVDGINQITNVVVGSGQQLTDYDFCETPAVVLSGYVFQDGDAVDVPFGQSLPERIADVRSGVRSSDDTYLTNVVMELRDGLSGETLSVADYALDGYYTDGLLSVTTDASGYYEFVGIKPGTYAVYQQQPDGYIDGVDTVGSTDGIAFNPGEPRQQEYFQLSVDPNNDGIVRITVQPGQQSIENNFSEVLVNELPQTPNVNPPPFNPPATPTPPPAAPPFSPSNFNPQSPPGSRSYSPQSVGAIATTEKPRSWHLSIINGGQPRNAANANIEDSIWLSAGRAFADGAVSQGTWVFDGGYGSASGASQSFFGLPGAIPFTGDFNGDGVDEIGVYAEGEWFIDINGNGEWDAADLWAKLGNSKDHPVVGDWDGDGKWDIGIYGREWQGDAAALGDEPGLPDEENRTYDEKKNVPRKSDDAAERQRVLRQGKTGKVRSDVVDHTFRFGRKADFPVTGDWNGDGISTIGVFRDGIWKLDVDGNGRWSKADEEHKFGREGDIPLVGDFDGDGLDDLAVFRDGVVIIDINGNGEIDSSDRKIQVGQPGDQPVVGDFDGDGVDEIAVYRPGAESQSIVYEARRAG